MKNNQQGFFSKIQNSKYYEAAEAGFWRIWENKSIWFWGIFISVGAMSFNHNQTKGKQNQVSKEEAYNFFIEYWQWILLAVGVALMLGIIFWLISIVARVGVIEELNKKQNNKKYVLGFKKIWEVGISKFKKIFYLDLVVIAIVFSFLLAVAGTIALAYFAENKLLVGFILGGIILVGSLILLSLAILKLFVQVLLLLGNLDIKESFIKSWNIIKNNIKELVKLCLTSFVISLIKGAIISVIFILIAVIGLSSYFLLITRFGFLMESVIIVLGVISFTIFFSCILVISAFFALWKMDLLIWWVKMIDGVKEKEIKKIEVEKKVIIEKKVVVGAGA